MNRRQFLEAATVLGTAAAAGAILASQASAQQAPAFPTFDRPKEERRGDMIYRPLGDTGVMVSLVGLGGHHIGQIKQEQDSIRLIRQAIDRGITFMDNCWDYHDGKSEQWMGNALRDGYREKVFLMSKIDGRDRKTAARQIDESLQRLQTDAIDLMQHHEIIRPHDPDVIFDDDGAQKALDDAVKAGKVKYIGFTGHKDPFCHLRMLEIAKQSGTRFHACQMPLNPMDAHFRSFEREVLPVLIEQKIGVLGMKALASGIILKSNTVKPIECLHYAMNLPTSVVITGIEKQEILDQALDAVRTFKPLDDQQLADLRTRTAQAAAKGEYEPFKTTFKFDGTTKNPKWMGI